MFCIHNIRNLRPFKYIKSSTEYRFLNQKKIILLLIIFLLIVFVLSAGFNIYQWMFATKIYYGVKIGPYYLGGKTQEEAESFLHQEIDKFLSQGFSFKALENKTTLPIFVSGMGSSDIAYSLVNYDFGKMSELIFEYGRSESSFKNIKDILKSLFFGYEVSPVFTVRDDLVLSLLREKFSFLEKKPQNASVDIKFEDTKPIVQLIADRNGIIFDYEAALEQFKKNLSLFNNQEIVIIPRGVSADVKSAEVSVLIPSITKIFDNKNFKIRYKKEEDKELVWNLPKEVLADWIIFKRDDGTVRLGLDAEKIRDYLQKKNIVSTIEIEPKNAKFVMRENKVIEFQASTTGRKINYNKTVKSFEQFFFTSPENKVVYADIVVDIEEPQIMTGHANTLGIKELIGLGSTNFSGSPPNRIHNIKNGATILSGILIQPGEIFSLNNALGEVGESTGFKPELVIKGDKTVPEYGGGLCQIATTLFRAAINSGLPILERANHSYRVSYYEPPIGMDATVYNPSPDLKFLNDTEAPILIQSKIEGNNLIFEFWGAKDGREVEIGVPVISNITDPEPTKYIETPDLKPGEKKCTEKPHKGADAYFDYKVIYPNGEEKVKRFKSHYRAWQEVCLVGVAATSTEAGL
jgi:vancomycin resistance protein YoaR